MGKHEKLIIRLLSQPKDFTWDELLTMLSYWGFREVGTGKTAGSRRRFMDDHGNVFRLHKPHPSGILKGYIVKFIITYLTEKKFIAHE